MTLVTIKDLANRNVVEASTKTKFDLPNNTGTISELDLQGSTIVARSQSGDDLILKLSNGEEIVLKDFFAELEDGTEHKLWVDSGEGYVLMEFGSTPSAVAESATVATGEVATTSALALPGLGAIGGLLGLGGVAAAGGGGGSDSEPEVSPTPTVRQTTATSVSGRGEPGATVTLTNEILGEPISALVNEAGEFVIEFPEGIELAEGETFTLTQTVDGLSESLPVEAAIDLTPPPAPTIDPTNGDFVSGTGEPGATVTVTTNEEPPRSFEALVDDDGNWTLSAEPSVASGVEISAGQVDASGNQSLDATLAIIDGEAPDAPEIDPTNGSSITGEAEANSTVTLIIDGGEPITVEVNELGEWEYIPETPLENGVLVTATASDAAGNESEAAEETVDTVPPAAPSVELSDGNVANGIAEPGATVLVTYPGLEDPIEASADPMSGAWTVEFPSELPHETVLTVTAVDPAGNESEPTLGDVDALHPDAPIIDPTQGDIITGSGEAGTTLGLTIEGFEDPFIVEVGENGLWSVDPDPDNIEFLPNGTDLSAVLTDAAGNVSETTEGATDSEPPLAPGIDPTNGTVLTGTSEPNATITINIEGQLEPVVVEANEDGVWSYAPPSQLPNETGFTATQTDQAGNTGPFAAEETDSEPPLAPEFNPSGPESISGNGEAGAELSLSFEGLEEPVIVTVDPEGNWEIPSEQIPEGIVEGTILVATQTDAAGNTSPIGTETVDTSEPQPFTVDPTDGTEISGTGEPGATVTITPPEPAEPIEVVVGPTGTFAVPIEPPLPHEVTVLVTQVDPAGNEAGPIEVEVDNEAPEAPEVDPTDGTEVTGTGEEGATVTVTYPGLSEPLTATVENGVWSVTPPEVIAHGIEVTATQTDAAGNESDDGNATVDSEAPDAPTLEPTNGTELSGMGEPAATVEITYPGIEEPLTAPVDPETGEWSLTGLNIPEGTVVVATQVDPTGNTSPTVTETVDATAPEAPVITIAAPGEITGTAEAGTAITLNIEDAEVGPIEVDEDGNWSTIETGASPFAGTVVATATDDAGNVSEPSNEVEIDGVAPAIPEFTTSATQAVGDGDDEPGAIITVFAPDGETVLGAAIVDEDGNWTAELTPTLTDGTDITATATDAVGNESGPATATIDAIAPDAPVFTTTTTTATGDGTAEPGTTVNVFGAGTLLGTAEVDPDGNWEVTLSPRVADATELTATLTDAVGNVSDEGEATADASAPVVEINELVTGPETMLSGTASEPNTEVEIFLGEVSLGTTTTNGAGDWIFTPEAPLEEGAEVSAQQTDATGNTGTGEQTVALDFDADGVANTVDIDDDNDGILDVNESDYGTVFETDFGNGLGAVPGVGTVIGGWEITAGNVDHFDNQIDLTGFIPGTIAQTITTVPGETYVLSFDYSSNQSGGGGGTSTFNVNATDDASSTEIATEQFATGSETFTPGTFTFVATGETTTLEFETESLAGTNRGNWLRNISLNGPTTDADGDGVINALETDSDGGGVSDNEEAQYGQNYVAPSGEDVDGDGLDDAYDENLFGAEDSVGLVPGDADSNGIADAYEFDLAAGELPVSITEALTSGISGQGVPGATVTVSNDDGELGQVLVGEDGTWSFDFPENDPLTVDPGETLTATQTHPDFDGVTGVATADAELDTDFDGVADTVDIDDDNDGIIDTSEQQPEATEFTNLTVGQSLRFDTTDDVFSGELVDNQVPGEIVSAGPIEFGAFFADNGSIPTDNSNNTPAGFEGQFRIEQPAAEANLQDAIDAGAYVDLTFTTADDPSRVLGVSGFSAPDGGFSGQIGILVNGELVSDGTPNTTTVDPNTAQLLNDAENTVRIVFYNDAPDIRFFLDHFDLTLASSEAGGFLDIDTDDDRTVDRLDTDSDEGGVSDNVEAQIGQDYVAPSGVDSDGDGLDDAYDQNLDGAEGSVGLTPNPAVYEFDPDVGELPLTIDEALTSGLSGTGLPGATVTITGSDGQIGEPVTVDEDGNWTLDIPQADPATVTEGETLTATQTHPDFDDAEGVATADAVLDTDHDGVIDAVDIDDDNDGILDENENTYVQNSGPLDRDTETAAPITQLSPAIITVAEAGTVTFRLSSDSFSAGDGGFTLENAETLAVGDRAFAGSPRISDATPTVDVEVDLEPGVQYQASFFVGGGGAVENINLEIIDSDVEIFVDTDGDGTNNALDTDSDNGGLSDNTEAQFGQEFFEASGEDIDGDGLDDAYDENLDGAEDSVGLTPADTNGDGLADAYVHEGTDPEELPITMNVELEAPYTGVAGTGVVGATITLTDGADELGMVLVSEDGTWTITTDDPIDAGTELVATQSDADHLPGATSTATETVVYDSDGDSVVDSVDIDDDNDGILDVGEEMPLQAFVGTAAGKTFNIEDGSITNTVNYTGPGGNFSGNGRISFVERRNGGIDEADRLFHTFDFTQPVNDIRLRFDSLLSNSNMSHFTVTYSDGTVQDNITVNRTGTLIVSEGGLTVGGRTGSPQGAGFVTLNDLNPDLGITSLSFQQVRGLGTGFQTATMRVEVAMYDADIDGIRNSLDPDSDNGGASDNVEAQHGDTFVAPSGIDSDGNGLDDAYESTPGAGEGLTATDADNNGIFDLFETANESDIDTDGDGVYNHVDIDDDNDGILDVDEEVEPQLVWFENGPLDGNTLTGSVGGVGMTYTGEGVIGTDSSLQFDTRFPDDFVPPTSNVLATTSESQHTVVFDQPVVNPTIAIASLGAGTIFRTLAFDQDFEILFDWATETGQSNFFAVDNGDGTITGNGSNLIVVIPGVHSEISFSYEGGDLVDFAFGFDNAADIDSDGIINRLDLDSDGDGIDDIVEAGGTDADGDGLVNDFVDDNGDGLDDAIDPGLSAPDTDQDGNADFVDTVFDLTAALAADLEDGSLTEGGGHSEINFDGADLSLDLTSVDNGVFTNVESIDISGSGENDLSLTMSDLVDLSPDSDALFVKGDADDTVVADGNFAANGSATVEGVTYDIYVESGATLFVEENVNVNLI